MKLKDNIGNIIFFIFLFIVGILAIFGAVNSAKECQIYPASECPDCIYEIEVMIWNRNLSSTEILNLYNNQSAKFYPSGTMLFEEVDCVDKIIKEQIKAEEAKEKIKIIYE